MKAVIYQMTIEELKKLYVIKKQIQQIEEKLSSISIMSSTSFSNNEIHTHNQNSPTERIATTKIKLKENLVNKLNKLYEEELKIEKFIDEIQDVEIQMIIRMRFIDLKTWKEIGKELEYDRTSPYYKLKKYLKGVKNNEN